MAPIEPRDSTVYIPGGFQFMGLFPSVYSPQFIPFGLFPSVYVLSPSVYFQDSTTRQPNPTQPSRPRSPSAGQKAGPCHKKKTIN